MHTGHILVDTLAWLASLNSLEFLAGLAVVNAAAFLVGLAAGRARGLLR